MWNGNASTVFESSVVLDGTKTPGVWAGLAELFESSVVLDGTKTIPASCLPVPRLRVVLF